MAIVALSGTSQMLYASHLKGYSGFNVVAIVLKSPDQRLLGKCHEWGLR